MLRRILFALLWLACAVSVQAENQVIGTVELILDGEAQTWYVLQPDGDLMPTAVWVAAGADQGMLSIAAYPDADIELIREEQMGSTVPVSDTPVLVIGIGFPIGAEQLTYTIPSNEPHPASVLLLENWSQPLDGYDISADPGEISLTGIEAGRGDDARFSGTFSGVLRRDEETKTVQGASFEVDRVPFVDPLSR